MEISRSLNWDFTGRTREYNGRTLRQIVAKRDFEHTHSTVREGTIGGWVQHASNLQGDAWITEMAKVYEEARVTHGAFVTGHAEVYGAAVVRDKAVICYDAKVHGNAQIMDKACISDESEVFGHSQVLNTAMLYGRVKVFGNAIVSGDAYLRGSSKVYGGASVQGSVTVADRAQIYGAASVSDGAYITGAAEVFGRAEIRGHVSLRDNAKVHGTAYVFGRAWIGFNADITEPQDFLSLYPIGSEGVTATFYRTEGGGNALNVGCWHGHLETLADEVEERAAEIWGDSDAETRRWEAEYKAFEKLCQVRQTGWTDRPALLDENKRVDHGVA